MKVIELYNLKSGLKSPLPSDTLWGNICWAIKYLYGDQQLSAFLNSYSNGTPELIISSSFPFIKNADKSIYFFPRPLLPHRSFYKIIKGTADKPLSEKLKDMVNRKDRKSILYIEQDFFEKILMGEADYEDQELSTTIPSPALVPESITRNTINRLQGSTLEINGTGQLFTEDHYFVVHTGSKNKSAEAGLFFLAHDNTEGKLEAALRLLSHIGIGGNRSVGKGVFDFTIADVQLNEPQNANALLNLSLYLPAETELNEYKKKPFLMNYELEQRKGFYGMLRNGRYEKNPVVYFKEGSVFPFISQKVFGKNIIEKAAGTYPLHRYGLTLMLKIVINEEKYREE